MKDLYIFVRSLEYIEQHLGDDLRQEDIAAYCCCSLSALQKMWKYCNHGGVMRYIKRRRLTLAARDLTDGRGVLETAVKYGYGSNEAFSRAFRAAWGVLPSDFAARRTFTGFYPKLDRELHEDRETGGIFMRVKFDLTELYDRLADKNGTYMVFFDIKNLLRINNELGRDLGDEVIKNCIERIDSALTGDMFAFRVGGDEFVIVTCSSDIRDAEKVRDAVTAGNDTVVYCGNVSAEAYLHSGITLYNGTRDIYERFDEVVERIV